MRQLFIVAALVFIVLDSSSVAAEGRGVSEIGIDLGGEVTFDHQYVCSPFSCFGRDRTLVLADVPSSTLRLGHFVTDAMQIEATVGFAFLLSDTSHALDDWFGRLGIIASYRVMRSSSVSPFIGSGFVANFPPESQGVQIPRFGVPIQLGVRIPVGDRLAARVETGSIWWVPQEGERPSWTVPIRLGLSLFTGPISKGGQP